MSTHDAQTNSDRLIHDLAEAITTLDAWTYLALSATSENEPAQQYLSTFRYTISLLIEITHMREPELPGCPSPKQARNHPSHRTMQQDHIICLECGKALQLLSHRHLSSHGLTPRTYKAKHRIAADQALSSPSVRRRRLQLARTRNPFLDSPRH